VHLWRGDGSDPARVGFVVSKAVGPAVVRNRVKRRLRHLARESLTALPGSAVLVVRANPAAADATYQELRADLDRCLQRVTS
jgi:ribonuclease P protein component